MLQQQHARGRPRPRTARRRLSREEVRALEGEGQDLFLRNQRSDVGLADPLGAQSLGEAFVELAAEVDLLA